MIAFVSLGSLIYLIGWIWLTVIAFKNDGVVWGIIVLVFGWVGGLIYCIVKKVGWTQFALMLIGLVLAGGIGGWGYMTPVPTTPTTAPVTTQ